MAILWHHLAFYVIPLLSLALPLPCCSNACNSTVCRSGICLLNAVVTRPCVTDLFAFECILQFRHMRSIWSWSWSSFNASLVEGIVFLFFLWQEIQKLVINNARLLYESQWAGRTPFPHLDGGREGKNTPKNECISTDSSQEWKNIQKSWIYRICPLFWLYIPANQLDLSTTQVTAFQTRGTGGV